MFFSFSYQQRTFLSYLANSDDTLGQNELKDKVVPFRIV